MISRSASYIEEPLALFWRYKIEDEILFSPVYVTSNGRQKPVIV